MVYKIVFVRHGESEWNKENKFTGWYDADLSEKGVKEAIEGGKMLKEGGYEFDVMFTSVLRRAIKTGFSICEQLDTFHIPVTKHWRLNERHYGGLQGLNKSETAAKHGEQQVKIWRRSYDVPPPPLSDSEYSMLISDPIYKMLDPAVIPRCECLKDTVARVLPFWFDSIVPVIKENKSVLVVAHGNSLRSLVKHLDGMTEAEIMEINIPTGIPLVYELDEQMKPIRHYYLASEDELRAAMDHVANQGKAAA